MTPSSDRREGHGGPDSLVEVGLWLFTLDCGGEGINGFIRTEHGGVPHGIVSLGREAETVSPRVPSNTAHVLPRYLKYHHAKAPAAHPSLSAAPTKQLKHL